MSIKTTLIRSGHRGLLQLRKYSPEILTGVGIVGGVTSGVLAAKATLKLEPIVDEAKEYIEVAKKTSEGDPKLHAQQLAYIYTRTALKIGKLYGPSVSLGMASIGCILGAHGIMRRRNAALIAGYKVMETAFAEYRERVAEAVGEEEERDLYFNAKEEVVDTEDGDRTVKMASPHGLSQYAKVFDPLNRNWNNSPDTNLIFLRGQERYANDRLKIRGHLFLNEVYDSLGLPHTKAGAVTGWVLNSDTGDGFVDFGIYDVNRPMALEFINGYESSIWLDFNVDGVIYDLI